MNGVWLSSGNVYLTLSEVCYLLAVLIYPPLCIGSGPDGSAQLRPGKGGGA
jgi:hypothetical protein